MSDRIDETKIIKRNIDEETVEQLVEGNFMGGEIVETDTQPKRTTKKKKKKKKNGLYLLIVLLSALLIFVLAFVISYKFFTISTETDPAVESTQQEQAAEPDIYAGDDMPDEDSKTNDTEKQNESVIPEDSATTQAEPEKDDKVSSSSNTPSSNSQTTTTPDKKPVSKPETTPPKKDNTQTETKPEPQTKAPDAVENSSVSEGIIFE